MVTAGPLGILGRNGWFCLESDVETWPELAGWRGLRNPAVRSHFNNTFWAYGAVGDDCSRGWGPNPDLMTNLGLQYEFFCIGDQAAGDEILSERLGKGLPTLFYLWEPHPFHKRFSLNRIQLPVYKKAGFALGETDYNSDILFKVASAASQKGLATVAPKVWQLLSRFVIDRDDQETMLDMTKHGVAAMDAACSWMEKNTVAWKAWQPDEGKHSPNVALRMPLRTDIARLTGSFRTIP